MLWNKTPNSLACPTGVKADPLKVYALMPSLWSAEYTYVPSPHTPYVVPASTCPMLWRPSLHELELDELEELEELDELELDELAELDELDDDEPELELEELLEEEEELDEEDELDELLLDELLDDDEFDEDELELEDWDELELELDEL
jgi:hypothetical protein